MPKQLSIKLNGKTIRVKSTMLWGEVEKAEEIMDQGQLNFAEAVKAAKTPEEQADLTAKVRKSSKEQMTFMKEMLLKHVDITEEQLKGGAFIDGLLLFGQLYKVSTNVTDFLEQPSEQPS